MRTLLPLLKTKLFVLGFVSACTIVLATTVPEIKNFIAIKVVGEKITEQQNTVAAKTKKQKKFINASRVTSGFALDLHNTLNATVQTDKADYQPGNIVFITGGGWEPGEIVSLNILSDCGCTNVTFYAEADEYGVIYNDEFVITEDHLGASFILTASGSETATTIFTDANDLTIYKSDCTTTATSFCLGETVCVKATTISGGNHNVQWFSPSDGTTAIRTSSSSSSSITDSYTPTQAGTWTVKLIKESNGTSDNTLTFIVNPIPTATATNGGPYCVGNTIQLTGGANGNAAYQWTGPNGFSTATAQRYTQDFNTLPSSGNTNTWTDNSTISNWYSNKTNIRAGTGSSNAGDLYSFGNTTERAIGSLASASTGEIIYGVKITNTTGSPISQVYVQYTGEQWRRGDDAANTLHFSYSVDPLATISTGTYTNETLLNFVAPISTGDDDALDGNLTANRTLKSATITLSSPLAAGSTIWLRWRDFNDPGNDDGLAVDDLIVYLGGNQNPTISGATGAMAGTYTLTVINSGGCSATATTSVIVDVTPPTFTTVTGTTLTLGCNPSASDINAALGTASATDAISTPTVSSSDASVQSNDCIRSQTRTFTAKDACNNTSTAERTVTWTSDNMPPSFTGNYDDVNLGCNPSNPDGSLGTATATDLCGPVTNISHSDGPVVSDGCNRSKTRLFTATDGCTNTATIARTVRWTEDLTAPGFTGSYADVNLGCNPANPSASLGTATATDACGTITNITSSDGPVVSNGCNRSITRTFTATDGCTNAATTSRTVNWIEDVTPPVLTPGGTGGPFLGCNPSAADIEGALGTATASDGCGATTVTQSDGPVISTGCSRDQVRTFTARDGCGNTSTVARTARWIEDNTPPVITSGGTGSSLGCNPSAGDIDGALGTATASDLCGIPTITVSDGNVISGGCQRTQTRSWFAIDGCNNTSTASRTVSWIEDLTPPVLTPGGTGGPFLGCNPSAADIEGALGTATASDGCGATTVTQSDGPVISTGCSRDQVRTFTARDGCGNTSTVARTARWIEDNTPPVITSGGTGSSLGCNPSAGDIDGALGTATASDLCGIPTITVSDGNVVSEGCQRTQTRSWFAIDGCNNTSTASRTVSWIEDLTPPVLTPGGTGGPFLGCNPSAADIEGALGTATASDGCGATTVTQSDGPVISTGCSRDQVRTFTARDGCGNTSTVARTARWIEDNTPPVLTPGGTGGPFLGCNPSAADIEGALGTATASDGCGATTVTQSDGPVISTGCSRDQVRTFTARDGCGNTSTVARTARWIEDNTPPVITSGGTGSSLGCNPSAGDINGALGTATASDACGIPTITANDDAVQSNGCARSQRRVWSAIDGCGNTSSAARTVTWIHDVTPPIFTGTYNDVPLGCNAKPSNIETALDGATATDACSNTTITPSDGPIVSTGCVRSKTRTFEAKDACGNTATISRTVTWTEDLTAPTITGSYSTVDLGCNPVGSDVTAALDGATATDACSTPTITFKDGTEITNGCVRTKTRTFTAKDACNNASTVSRTVTWVVDVTAPTFTGTYTLVNLDCNPSANDIGTALGTATATDACSTPTISQSDGSVTSTGCVRTQTRTFTAIDACQKTSTVSRTVTWIVDVTEPVFTGSYLPIDLDCNPSANQIGTALGSATANDGCSTPTITHSDGTVQSDGCVRSQTRTFTAKDHCGNSSEESRTVTWIVDVTAPTFTGTYSDVDLGCNAKAPAIASALGSATATDACSEPTITQSDGGVMSNGCNRSQTRTFTAKDHCGNTATVTRTARWIADDIDPVFTGTYTNVDLGCNPVSSGITGALGTATATDGCSTPTVYSFKDDDISSNGCFRSQTRTFFAKDGCENISTISRTVTWIVDVTPPDFSGSYADVNLGCNPANPAASLGTASATDACGTITNITSSDGPVVSTGCNRSQTRTFTAKDGCNNTSTVARTVRWIADVTAPYLQAGGTSLTLGCNPSASDIEAALGTATATDACSTPTLSQSDGPLQSNGCSRSQKRTFTAIDGCNNTTTVCRIVTWTYDVTPPSAPNVTSNYKCYGDVPAANPAVILSEQDNCGGTPSVEHLAAAATDNGAAGCPGNPRIITRYYRLTDGCNNTSTVSHTITIVDDEAPTATCKSTLSITLGTTGSVTITGADLNNGSTDNCTGSLTYTLDKYTFTDAEVGTTCSKAFTVKFTATDVCGNTATCSSTVTVNKRSTTIDYTGDNEEQYSDNTDLRAVLKDAATNTPLAGKTITFTIGSQTTTAVTDAYGVATKQLTITQNVGDYDVVASFAGDGIYCGNSVSEDYDILKEDACGTYTGTYFINTNPSTGQATVHFEIIVKEDADGSLGDVRNSTVTFHVTDANTNATIGTFTGVLNTSASTSTQAVYYYDYVVSLGNALCKTLDVEWIINSYYTNEDCSDQETEVTVAAPANDFSAGGGYIVLTPNTGGTNAGTVGTKNNFGYNVKFNNSLTNLQGNFNTIIRRNGRTYQVKSNKPTFLKITVISAPNTLPIRRKAEITYGNAVLKDVTDFVNGVCVAPSCWSEGGGTVLLTVEDNGEPGSIGASLDRIGFTVKNKNGVQWFSTNTYTLATNSTALQNLDGGNIQIRQGGTSGGTSGGISNQTVQAEIATDVPSVIMPFDVKVFPNPSQHQFSMFLENGSNEKVQITVYDALGRLVKTFEKANGNTPIRFGADMKNGTYFVEVRQGDNRKTLKLIKQ